MQKITRNHLGDYLKAQVELFDDQNIYNMPIAKTLDDLYNLSLSCIASLNKKKTFIIRKRYGILDDGISQSVQDIAKALNTGTENIRSYITRIEHELVRYIIYEANLDYISLDTKISNLKISTYTIESLQKGNIFTIGDITRKTKEEILKINNIGKKSLDEVEKLIIFYGYNFRVDEIDESKDIKNISIDTNIKYLKLSTRTYNALLRNKIYTLADILINSRESLLAYPGLSFKTVEEIEKVVNSLGYKLSSLYGQNFGVDEIDEFKDIKNISIDTNIKYLKLSTRTYNALLRNKIYTLADILINSRESLLAYPGLSFKTVEEIEKVVNTLGYQLSTLENSNKIPYELNINIMRLGFSIRTYNCLNKVGIETLRDVINRSIKAYLQIPDFSFECIEEIIDMVHSLGFHLLDEEYINMKQDDNSLEPSNNYHQKIKKI